MRRKDRQDVRVTKTMCVVDCWTDHRLVVSKPNLRNSACTKTTRQEGAEEIGCLQAETRQQEASIRQQSLQPFRCTGTQFRRCRRELTVFRYTVHYSAMDSLGPVFCKHQDWFDENDKEIQGLLQEKLTSEIPAQYHNCLLKHMQD